MGTRPDILANWLAAILAFVVVCGLVGCWMLFRTWWRRQFLDRRPADQRGSTSPDLWQLSGQRLVSKIDRSPQDPTEDDDGLELLDD